MFPRGNQARAQQDRKTTQHFTNEIQLLKSSIVKMKERDEQFSKVLSSLASLKSSETEKVKQNE